MTFKTSVQQTQPGGVGVQLACMAETQSLVVVVEIWLCFTFLFPTPDGILMLRLDWELEPELKPRHCCIPAFSFPRGVQWNPRCVKLELCTQHRFVVGRPGVRMNVC